MKVLFKDKIVETFKFPLAEAMTFSILVWTMWGLAESFYWQRIVPFIDKDAMRLSPFLYIASFFIYLTIAAIVAVLMYSIVRWILFTMDRQESPTFRSATLTAILGVFFLAIGYYSFTVYLLRSSLPRIQQYGIMTFFVLFAIVIMALVYRSASNLEFRIRRSGTAMLSILIVSIILSFVSFPLFSDMEATKPAPAVLDLKSSIRKLMAYQYLSPAADKK
jgi:hypothetical protein